MIDKREKMETGKTTDYQQIPAWVHFRFQFQPGLKYFM